MNVKPWYERLLGKLIAKDVSARDAAAMVKGTSKHARGKAKPKNLKAKRKAARKQAKESRRKNRR
jgi:hypothetical protein